MYPRIDTFLPPTSTTNVNKHSMDGTLVSSKTLPKSFDGAFMSQDGILLYTVNLYNSWCTKLVM